jgi:hypothetical protein
MPTKNDDAKESGSQENIKVCPYAPCKCISENKGHCFHGPVCEPCDDRGRRFLIITDVQDGQVFTHTRYLPERVIAPIIDSDESNAALALADRVRGRVA